MAKTNTIIYGYRDLSSHKIVYVGLDSTGRRHKEHLKPSKYKEQPINQFLQDTEEGDMWEYVEIAVLKPLWNLTPEGNKYLAHKIETAYIKTLLPLYNINGKEEEDGE